MRNNLLRLSLLLTILCLGGCSKPAGQELLEDYLYRLSNALDINIDNDLSSLPPVDNYPPRRERQIETLELREGLLDTLNLGHCNLLPLIAERNSSLGKVMPVSQELIYEFRFYTRIRDCRHLPAVREDSELRSQVEAIYETKHQNLPRVLWNAIYGAPELEANFALGELPLEPGDNSTLGPVLNSLQHFEKLIQLSQQNDPWQPPEFLTALEEDYEVLNSNRYGAQWISSIRLMTTTLSRAAAGLEARLNTRKLCPQGRPTPKAKILHNVFRKYYAGNVQPYLAQVHRGGQRWLEQHHRLLNMLSHSDRLQSYRDSMLSEEGMLWQNYLQARDRHTAAWQRQLGQCALMPGGKNTG